MYLTVTPNSALDRIFFIEQFVPGTVLRTEEWVESVGGKGLDASVALRALQQDTLALGFIAGETGKTLLALLESYGIRTDLVWVAGNTRIAHVIVEKQGHRHTHLTVGGYAVSAQDFSALIERYDHWLPQTDWVILAGSIPAGFPIDGYGLLAERAKEAGVPVLIDCSGEPVRRALVAYPSIIKMNRAEFCQTFATQVQTQGELIQAAQRVREQAKIQNLVITCGEEGLLAFTGQRIYQAVGPYQVAVNAAGAGDAASAALVWRLSKGAGWPEALRWAAATSAAVVLTPGTADCRLEDITRILDQVEIQNIPRTDQKFSRLRPS